MGIDTVLDLLTHYPRRYADRTATPSRSASSSRGRRGDRLGDGATVSTRRLRGGAASSRSTSRTAPASCSCTFLQPALAGTAARREGCEVVVFGKVDLLPVGACRWRTRSSISSATADRPDRARSTRSPGKAGIGSTELAAVRRRGARAGRASSPTRLPSRGGRGSAWSSRTEAFQADPRARELDGRDRPPGAGSPSTSCCGSSSPSSCASAPRPPTPRGIAHVVEPPEGAAPTSSSGSSRALPFELTAAQARVIGEIAARPRPPRPDAPAACRATSARARRSSPWPPCSTRSRAATRARSWSRPRCSPSSTTSRPAACSAGSTVADPAGSAGRARCTVALLTSRTAAAERARLHDELAARIGRHPRRHPRAHHRGGPFASLGVVVIDEQHRFGVDQRAALREKGSADAAASGHDPDLLVMTATPIPRTAAMTVYGDLDYSVLDELPPARTPVATSWVDDARAEEKRLGEGARRGAPGTRPTSSALVRTGGGADEADGGRLARRPGRGRRPTASGRCGCLGDTSGLGPGTGRRAAACGGRGARAPRRGRARRLRVGLCTASSRRRRRSR